MREQKAGLPSNRSNSWICQQEVYKLHKSRNWKEAQPLPFMQVCQTQRLLPTTAAKACPQFLCTVRSTEHLNRALFWGYTLFQNLPQKKNFRRQLGQTLQVSVAWKAEFQSRLNFRMKTLFNSLLMTLFSHSSKPTHFFLWLSTFI